jgi:hypothetical protein
VPVVVIRDADRLALIHHYLRVEALRRLHRDTAIATTWPVRTAGSIWTHCCSVSTSSSKRTRPRSSHSKWRELSADAKEVAVEEIGALLDALEEREASWRRLLWVPSPWGNCATG